MMASGSGGVLEATLDHVLIRVEAADRDILGIVRERRLGNEADELGPGDAAALGGGEVADGGDDFCEGHGKRVVNVHRDLREAPLEREPDRADAGEPAAGLAN